MVQAAAVPGQVVSAAAARCSRCNARSVCVRVCRSRVGQTSATPQAAWHAKRTTSVVCTTCCLPITLQLGSTQQHRVGCSSSKLAVASSAGSTLKPGFGALLATHDAAQYPGGQTREREQPLVGRRCNHQMGPSKTPAFCGRPYNHARTRHAQAREPQAQDLVAAAPTAATQHAWCSHGVQMLNVVLQQSAWPLFCCQVPQGTARPPRSPCCSRCRVRTLSGTSASQHKRACAFMAAQHT